METVKKTHRPTTGMRGIQGLFRGSELGKKMPFYLSPVSGIQPVDFRCFTTERCKHVFLMRTLLIFFCQQNGFGGKTEIFRPFRKKNVKFEKVLRNILDSSKVCQA